VFLCCERVEEGGEGWGVGGGTSNMEDVTNPQATRWDQEKTFIPQIGTNLTTRMRDVGARYGALDLALLQPSALHAINSSNCANS